MLNLHIFIGVLNVLLGSVFVVLGTVLHQDSSDNMGSMESYLQVVLIVKRQIRQV